MSGRIRSIKPEWLDDERLVLASSDARTLSIALLLLADDFGNGRASLPLLAGRVFPGKLLETLANALAELDGWFVQLYEADGQQYFHIRNWSKHQKVDKPGKPRVPAPLAGLGKSRGTPAKVPESLAPDRDLDLEGDQDQEGDGTAPVAPRRAAEQPSPATDSEHQATEPKLTTCPLDLPAKAEAVGIVRDFVEAYRVEPEQIRDAVREFTAHWTIGGGSGRKEANWPRKLRADLKWKCTTPGKLKSMGELGHAEVTRETRQQSSSDSSAMNLMREAEALAARGGAPRPRPAPAPVRAAPAGALVSDLSKALGGRA